jgi:protein phosphatase
MGPDASGSPTITVEFAARTDVGRVREQNEDTFGEPFALFGTKLASHGHLFAVADGMGGHFFGDYASRLAIDTLLDTYYRRPAPASAEEFESALAEAVSAANTAVFEQARAHGMSMGTTLVALLLRGCTGLIVNVGDSRIYHVRQGEAHQITRDHSLVAEQVRLGLMTEEEARYSRARNIITRSIGHRVPVEMDLDTLSAAAGDVFVLSSDGLHNLVEPEEIAAAVTDQALAAAAEHLITLANERGGSDNITCLLVRVIECADEITAELPIIEDQDRSTD